MNIERRRFILSATAAASAAALGLGAAPGSVHSQTTTPPPDQSTLMSGDLLWPKQPGAFVPYNSTSGSDYEAQKDMWYREKRIFIRSLRDKPGVTQQELDMANRLERISFPEFLRLYQGDHDEDYVAKFGGTSSLYVGHVGIVDRSSGIAFVVEAVGDKGVQRISYADWLAGRSGQIFWHGRVIDGTDQQRAGIAAAASKYIGVPYSFWSFDLSDVSGFYCSKLAWLSIFSTLGVAVDDQPNPKRLFWFSPKQLMKSKKHVRLLVNPGNYAVD